MIPSYLMLVLATFIAMKASLSVHRYLGLCAIAVGGAGVNYFLMEPVFSFRVSQTGDIAALSLYGALGTLVSLRPNRKALPAFRPRSRTAPLDTYHSSLLAQLSAEISRTSGSIVDSDQTLHIALQRLRRTVDEEGTREILEDIRVQLAYEDWIQSRLAVKDDDQPG